MALTKVSYSMIESAPANVLNFGADPTGVADSTAAINAALDASDQVFMPAGTYKVSSGELTFNTGNELFGVFGKTIINGTLWNGYIFAVQTVNDVQISNITVNSAFSSRPLTITNSNRVTVRNCTFNDGTNDGIYIQTGNGISILDCYINDAFRNGISVIGGTNITIDGCEIVGTNAARTGGSPFSGIDVEPDSGSVVDGILINNNYIYNWAGHGCAFAGISPSEIRNAKCTNNTIINSGFDCIAVLGANTQNVVIDSNTIYTGSRGVFSNNVGATPAEILISNNSIFPRSGVTTALGIEFQVDTQALIIGNKITAVDVPIKISNCISGVNIVGNLISDATNPLTISSSSFINIVGNQFKVSYGIDLQTANGVLVSDNLFCDMPAAATQLIWARISSTNINVTNNAFYGAGAGLTSYFTANGAGANVRQANNTWQLATAAPTTGYWVQGDIVYNTTPASAGFIGFVCTVTGSPGTWRTFGLIS
jgi:hypothetical protein